MKYQISGFLKLSAEDNYRLGEIGKTQISSVDVTLSAETVSALTLKVCELFGAGSEDLTKNADGLPGLLHVSIMETADGTAANPVEIDMWKRGLLKLYSVLYTGQLEVVNEIAFPE